MFTKLKLIYDAAMLVVSLFGKAKQAYKSWKISQIEKAIQKRKDHLKENTTKISEEALKEPSEESDEKLKEYYRKLYRTGSSK